MHTTLRYPAMKAHPLSFIQQTNSPAKNGDYHPSSSTGPTASGSKRTKIVHTYSSGSNSRTRGPCGYSLDTTPFSLLTLLATAPAYSTASSHPLAQSALPPPAQSTTFLASPLKPRSRAEEDESYLSEDAEGESDDGNDEGDASGEVFETDYAAQSRARVIPATAGSGEGEHGRLSYEQESGTDRFFGVE